jgi:hypothetical protein
MRPEWRRDWPNLGPHNGRLTSEETPDYNCLALCAGKTDDWWGPYVIPPERPGIIWPPGVHPDNTPGDWGAALATVGFVPCEDSRLEEGFVKVALYANSRGDATHVAIQLADGRWKSKLGIFEDIEHDDPGALEGGLYGAVHSYLKRPLVLDADVDDDEQALVPRG